MYILACSACPNNIALAWPLFNQPCPTFQYRPQLASVKVNEYVQIDA